MYSVLNPLDQFEIRNLVEINILNLSIKLTNFMLYVIMSYIIPVFLIEKSLHLLKILSTKWSIVQESIYTTIHGMVINQINNHKGQIYFPFIYALFIFILVNNLIGLVTRCLYPIINYIYIFMLSNFFIGCGATHQKVILYSSSTSNFYSYNNQGNSTPSCCCEAAGGSSYSYNNNQGNYTNTLNPYYITGFTDGEGCFSISIYKDSRMLTGWLLRSKTSF